MQNRPYTAETRRLDGMSGAHRGGSANGQERRFIPVGPSLRNPSDPTVLCVRLSCTSRAMRHTPLRPCSREIGPQSAAQAPNGVGATCRPSRARCKGAGTHPKPLVRRRTRALHAAWSKDSVRLSGDGRGEPRGGAHPARAARVCIHACMEREGKRVNYTEESERHGHRMEHARERAETEETRSRSTIGQTRRSRPTHVSCELCGYHRGGRLAARPIVWGSRRMGASVSIADLESGQSRGSWRPGL